MPIINPAAQQSTKRIDTQHYTQHRTLDYVVPPPASAAAAPKAMPTARVIATPVGGDEKSSAFDPVMAK